MRKVELSVGDISFEIDDQRRVTVRGAFSVTTVVPVGDGNKGTYEVTVESGNMSYWFLDVFLTGNELTPLRNAGQLALVMSVDKSKNLTEVFAQDGIGLWTQQHLLFSSKVK